MENIAFFSFVELGQYSDTVAIDHSPKLNILQVAYSLSPRTNDVPTPPRGSYHICSCRHVFAPQLYGSDLSQCLVFFSIASCEEIGLKFYFITKSKERYQISASSQKFSFLSTIKSHRHLPLYSLQ